jgi:hypothetical protein
VVVEELFIRFHRRLQRDPASHNGWHAHTATHGYARYDAHGHAVADDGQHARPLQRNVVGPNRGIPLKGWAFGSIPRSHVGDGSGIAQ